MSDIESSLTRALHIDGCRGAALVDYESGLCLGVAGNPGFDLELAAAGEAEVVRAAKSIRDKLAITHRIEGIVSAVTGQYHIIRMIGTRTLLYVAIDRRRGNLALAHRQLASIDRDLDTGLR